MNALSIDDLVKTTGGPLRPKPRCPLIDGKFSVLGRSVGHSSLVRPGDLYWDFPGRRPHSMIEEACARGTRGVVSERAVETAGAAVSSVQVQCAATCDRTDESAWRVNASAESPSESSVLCGIDDRGQFESTMSRVALSRADSGTGPRRPAAAGRRRSPSHRLLNLRGFLRRALSASVVEFP